MRSKTRRYMIACMYLVSGTLLMYADTAPAQGTGDRLIKDFRFRNIGPANMSGRIADIEALEDDYRFVIVGSASGGVWKSTNAGNTFEPIFDTYGAASIGDLAIFQPNPDIIWVGTGEKNSRNSAAWGDGIYKTTDGGNTFTNMGLRDTYNIGGVVTHPTNPDIVYVGALGNAWGPGNRGMFKTTNGGKTWEKLTNGLPDDQRTGASDLVMHPENPDILYAGFWERRRQPFRLDSGGPNGGIFKTTDGGKTWKKLTRGLPPGDTGKIGVAISRSNPQVLMAMVEHSVQLERNDPNYDDMSVLGSGLYRSEDNGESWTYMNRYFNRPFYYNHVWINPVDDNIVYVLAGSMQYSTDKGATLQRPRGRGIHSDYHALWLDPHNKDRYYVGNDGGAYLTHDHGDNYIKFDNYVISQFYMIGVDMRDPYYVYGGLQDNGTWGGPSRTRDSAVYTDLWYTISGGDGYHVQVDPTDWRIVYSEPHPGNTGGRIQVINAETRVSKSIRPQKGQNIVNYDQYITPEIEQTQLDKGWGPSPGNGMGAFRWNWSSPIVMSPHNPHTVFFGANHLFKTIDQGETWYLISPDLSKNDPYKTIKESGGMTPDHNPGGGAEFYGTIITISESPVKANLIWVGTDDGNVQLTLNGGEDWTNVRNNVPGVPEDLWVSRVEASHFEEGACYLTFDGHRSANFEPWIFKTTDFGSNWTKITRGIPVDQPVYVVKEDLKNSNLLFAGTEFAVYYSINAGGSWNRLNNNLPTVAVHDLVVHPRDNDLVLGTHGRGIWIMDDITALQQTTDEVLASDAHLYENRTATQWLRINTGGGGGSLYYRGENPPNSAFVHYYLGNSVRGQVNLEISDITGKLKRTYQLDAVPGIGRIQWDMTFDPPEMTPEQQRQMEERQAQFGGRGGGRGGRGGRSRGPSAGPGTYKVTMTANGQTYTSTITIREDPLLSKNK